MKQFIADMKLWHFFYIPIINIPLIWFFITYLDFSNPMSIPINLCCIIVLEAIAFLPVVLTMNDSENK